MNRILLFMAHRENRRLLQTALTDGHEVVVAEDVTDLRASFDLGVVDGLALDRHWQQVQARKEADAPLFLPILLVTSRQDVGMATRRLWQVVDELLLAPIQQVELRARIKALLRSRRFSRESETRYYTLAERSPVGIYIQQDERIVYANPTFVQLCGVSDDELLEARLRELIHPDDRTRVAAYQQKALETDDAATFCETRLLASDDVRWVRLQVTQIVYRGKPAVLGIVPDVTDRVRTEQELQRYAQRLENLHAIDRAILEAKSVEAVAEGAARRLRTYLPCERASVVLFDHDADEAHIVTTDMEGRLGPPAGTRLPIKAFSEMHAAPGDLATQDVRYIEDVATLQEPAPALARLREYGVRSMISAPLLVEDDLLGELNLGATRPAAFTPQHRRMAREVADQLAIALQQANLLQAVRQRANRLKVLYTIQRAATRSLQVDELLATALEATIDVLDVAGGVVYLTESDGEGLTLYLQVQRGLPDQFVKQVRTLRPGEGISGRAVAERQPVVVSAAEYSTERLAPAIEQQGFRTLASTPLMAGGSLLGALTLAARWTRPFPAQEVDLLETIGQQLGQALQNAHLYQAEQRRRQELDLLYTLSRQLVATNEMETALADVARHAVERVHVTFCRIITREDAGFVCQTAYPLRRMDRTLEAGRREPPSASGHYRRVLRAQEPCILHGSAPDLTSQERKALYLDVAQSLCLVPLSVGGEAIGVLALGEQRNHEREPFDDDKLHLVTAIADQVANALHRTRLHAELEESYVETVLALARAMDARDSYTGDHSENLAEMALAIARELGCSDDEIRALRWGALLHDIGKIGVPDSILLKPGPLTDEEWELMQRHPDIGADILTPVKKLSDVEPIVRAHQEKYDGSGYPQGLSGEEIPLGARILAVVDAYSAIIDKRPYKEARSHHEAVAELKRCAGSHFDPQIVAAFMRVLAGSHTADE